MVRRAAGPWGAAMSGVRRLPALMTAFALLAATGCDGIRPPRTAFEDKPATPAPASAPQPRAVAAAATAAGAFQPPDEAALGDDAFSDLVRRGRDIFLDTRRHAPEYVGNGLACGNATSMRGGWPTRRRCGVRTGATRSSARKPVRSTTTPSACRAASSTA